MNEPLKHVTAIRYTTDFFESDIGVRGLHLGSDSAMKLYSTRSVGLSSGLWPSASRGRAV
jgi:hypothetical protein